MGQDSDTEDPEVVELMGIFRAAWGLQPGDGDSSDEDHDDWALPMEPDAKKAKQAEDRTGFSTLASYTLHACQHPNNAGGG